MTGATKETIDLRPAEIEAIRWKRTFLSHGLACHASPERGLPGSR
jgi:hypothetical protein